MPPPSRQLYSTVSRADPLEFYANHGLDAGVDYRKVSKFLDFDTNDLSKLSGVSRRSVRFDQNIPRDLRERLIQIANICNLVAEYFDGDPQKTALWFHTINPMIGGLTPRNMIRLGRYKKLLKFVTQARSEEAPATT